MYGGAAGGFRGQNFRITQGSLTGRTFPGEDGDLIHSVEACLHGNRRGSAAGAENRDLLSDDVHVVVTTGLHIPFSVGAGSDQPAVFDKDGVDCAAHLPRGKNFIHKTQHLRFVGHGDVKATGTQRPQAVYRLFQGFLSQFKSQIDVIQSQCFECGIVHHGRFAVPDGIGEKTDQTGVSCDSLCHGYLLLCLCNLTI